jgi:hypothetical protein
MQRAAATVCLLYYGADLRKEPSLVKRQASLVLTVTGQRRLDGRNRGNRGNPQPEVIVLWTAEPLIEPASFRKCGASDKHR